MLGTPIWLNMRVPGPRLKNPSAIPVYSNKDCFGMCTTLRLYNSAKKTLVKNPNKNPVAERAIEELGLELLNLSPEGGPVSDVTLALATANTNSRIRRDGLSVREVWTQRDQLTGEQLPIDEVSDKFSNPWL